LEAVNWEEPQHICELNECLEDVVSAAQPQHQSFSSTYADTLPHDLFAMKAASNLKYENSSQSIACGDLGNLNISVIRKTFHIFDDKWTFGTHISYL